MLDFLQSDTESGPRFSPEELEALILAEEARESLYAYTKLTWPPDYFFNWHHMLVIDYLEQVERGEIDRLMILMPPRYSKSELASIHFPCWYLGRNPNKKVILASNSDSLAEDFGRDTRNLIGHPIHELAFPTCRLSKDTRAKQVWNTEAGGKFVAAGVGSSKFMGRGAHLLILDDLIGSWADAQSEAERKKVIDWYKGTLFHRRQKDAAIVIVNTRWNADDLPGNLLDEDPDRWTVVRIPAIAEHDTIYRSRFFDKPHIYKQGETLWPAMFDMDFINETKKEMGTIQFEPIYQQNPQAAEGNIFKHKYWKRAYTVPGKILRVIQSWDTGYKKGDDNSYSACTTWVETENCYWLVHAWWGKVSFPELKRRAVALYQDTTINTLYGRPNEVLVEDKASGQSLVDELEEDTTLPVKRIQPEGDKVARAHIVSPAFETGNVGILEGKVWTVDDGKEVTSKDVIDICAKFPGVKNKDIVDSITQAVQHLRHGNTFKYSYHYASNGKRKSIFDREREARENGGE